MSDEQPHASSDEETPQAPPPAAPPPPEEQPPEPEPLTPSYETRSDDRYDTKDIIRR